MKKSILLLLMVSMLVACSGTGGSHNGKACPKEKQGQTACNRTPMGR